MPCARGKGGSGFGCEVSGGNGRVSVAAAADSCRFRMTRRVFKCDDMKRQQCTILSIYDILKNKINGFRLKFSNTIFFNLNFKLQSHLANAKS